MFDSLTNGSGLDAVIWVQSSGNNLFDTLAEVLDFMGLPLFFLIVLPLFYWSVEKRLGTRLVLALVVGAVINTLLKQVFQEPRPYHVSPEVMPLVEADNYGFPSGHVMNSIVVWGPLVVYAGRRWLALVLALYVVLVGWSRMYAGVHYPQDVIGGALIGLVLLAIFLRFFDPLRNTVARMPVRSQSSLVFITGLAALTFMFDSDEGPMLAGIIWGAGTGLLVEAHLIDFGAGGPTDRRALRYLLGLVLLAALFFGLDALLESQEAAAIWEVPVFMVIGFVALAGWPWLAIQLGLMSHHSPPAYDAPPVDLWKGA